MVKNLDLQLPNLHVRGTNHPKVDKQDSLGRLASHLASCQRIG
jgi:hypothetical protein